MYVPVYFLLQTMLAGAISCNAERQIVVAQAVVYKNNSHV